MHKILYNYNQASLTATDMGKNMHRGLNNPKLDNLTQGISNLFVLHPFTNIFKCYELQHILGYRPILVYFGDP